MAIQAKNVAKCPHCNCDRFPDAPTIFYCGSRVDGSHRSETCVEREVRLHESPKWLRGEVKRLQTIVRASFLAWDAGGTDGLALTGLKLSRETEVAIIEICKPQTEAPTAAEKEAL